jgi:cellobiose phosphorylase
MKYGYFDNKSKEYVITRPDTPLPWINYLGADEYCAMLSNTGGGYSFYKDARERRILRYRYNNIPMDRGGRYFYIRDNKSKDYWSATWQPVLKDLKDYDYECRHGLGYTKISTKYAGMSAESTFLVPLKENLEIMMVTLKNETKRKRTLSLFSFVEFCLWDALNDMTDYQYNLNIGETYYSSGTIYHLSRFRVEGNYLSYFACANAKVASFDSQRRDFLGNYGSLEAPEAVIKGKCKKSIACGWSPVGAHQISINLGPKEEKTIIFVLGYAEKPAEVPKTVKKFKDKESVLAELNKLKKFWETNISRFSVDTEDDEVNTMANIWNQYQCRTTFNWSRSASYYEAGIGRGMGFRDSNQDTLGFVHQIPEKVKERIIDLASTQFEEGDAYHQYSPLTKKGNGRGYSDDHLWLVLSTASYIKESGDIGFLTEKVPYDTGKKSTMYEHLVRAINYSVENVGPHGLPLIGFADWNDCLNLNMDKGRNKAESVMVAMMLVAAAKEMVRLAELFGEKEDAIKFSETAKSMSDQINKVAWDGAWYVRAFDDNGDPVGSSKNKEGQIYLETQPWAIMSGVAEGERAKKCMDSVKKYLATEHGVMILQPSYSKFHPELGSITVYPPGLKENGAIFCHPNPWAMIAEAMLGRGENAFKYYKAILPAARNKIAKTHKVEPYVYCQMIAGADHKDFGEGKNSWLTGSGSWNFVAISQWILGIRADYNGLIVDPSIPKTWDGFEVKRHFRGCDYYITIRNPKHVSKGVKSVTVDGVKTGSNLIPAMRDKKEHHVEVIMG